MPIITKENIAKFCYTNEELLGKAPRAIVLEFHGLGGGLSVMHEHPKLGYFFADNDMIYAQPYYGPWSWMNRNSIDIIDEIIDALYDKYCVKDERELPVVSTGLSMGGLGALIYSRYSRHTPTACAALCPVCDLVYHYSEREDTARTIYNAFYDYHMPIEEAMKTGSPLHQAEYMPDIPYLIFATTKDEEVDYTKHSDLFVAKMKQLGRNIQYVLVPDRPHCDLSPVAVEQYKDFIVRLGK